MFINQLFPLGRIVATPVALETLRSAGLTPLDLLKRHVAADWGDQIAPEDRKANDDALRDGGRLLSGYNVNQRERIWIITEADRSVTTLMIPEEY
jgi:hypothetical protein